MEHLEFLKTYPEQFNYCKSENEIQYNNELRQSDFSEYTHSFYGKNTSEYCYKVRHNKQESEKAFIETSYFIGVDIIPHTNKVIHISPKIDTENCKVDYFKIVEESLNQDLSPKDTEGLFRIEFDKDFIKIKQEDDYLSPLLFAQFLNILKTIVKKGLRRSFYSVEENLNARVRGKILVGSSIRNNLLKGRVDRTYCKYQQYGLNHIENKVLKKALEFVTSNISNHKSLASLKKNIIYCKPFFNKIDSNVDESQVRNYKANPFYAEYSQAIQLAKLILKRYGFKIENTTKTTISTPPFWVDMSKVFELNVYKKLKEKFVDVNYEPYINGYYPDFLVSSKDFTGVIDAKYKPRYRDNSIDIADIRQVSAYSRMSGVYDHLAIKDKNTLMDCLIIYSDQTLENEDIDFEKCRIVKNYEQLYKIGFKLPLIE